MLERIVKLVEKLASLVSYSSASGETPNPVKLLQVHLKQALFNSQAIKGSFQSLHTFNEELLFNFLQMRTTSRAF